MTTAFFVFYYTENKKNLSVEYGSVVSEALH